MNYSKTSNGRSSPFDEKKWGVSIFEANRIKRVLSLVQTSAWIFDILLKIYPIQKVKSGCIIKRQNEHFERA